MSNESDGVAAERIKAWKDLIWNIAIFTLAGFLLFVGWDLGRQLIKVDQPAESIRVIAIVSGIPAFLVLAGYNRLSSDAIGTILGAIIGYAPGRVG
jgi:hypothetical protein